VKTRTKIIISGAAIVTLTAAGTGVALSSDDDDGTEMPITGVELEKASDAAFAFTGGGTVTETEAGDEESYYEVEVRRPDGSSVDVQLDEQFNVVDAASDDDSVND
jgi:uncharacterized membrane protein YkoI